MWLVAESDAGDTVSAGIRGRGRHPGTHEKEKGWRRMDKRKDVDSRSVGEKNPDVIQSD